MFSNIIQWIMSVLMYSTQNSSHKITDLPNFLVLKQKSWRADKNLQRNSTTMLLRLFLATNAQRKTKQNCDNMTHFWTLNLYQADVQIFAVCFYSFFQALAYVCLALSWNFISTCMSKFEFCFSCFDWFRIFFVACVCIFDKI